jgi:hypothetical protein
MLRNPAVEPVCLLEEETTVRWYREMVTEKMLKR